MTGRNNFTHLQFNDSEGSSTINIINICCLEKQNILSVKLKNWRCGERSAQQYMLDLYKNQHSRTISQYIKTKTSQAHWPPEL